MPYNIILRADTLRSLAFGSIISSYTAIGTALTHPSRLIMVQNMTDGLLVFSFDGVVDHFVLPSNGQVIFDFTTNQVDTAGAFIATGTVMYVKRSATPTLGSVYVSMFYGKGD